MSVRILIVDDNEMNLKLAATTLRYEGYEVITAIDAQTASELLRSDQQIDLILMDLSLPTIDGLTFTRQIKAESRTANIPVVILTASAMRGDAKNALSAGANGYITKPIDVKTFPQLISRYLKPAG